MNNLKKLELANDIAVQIRKLDKEIIELERICQNAANGDCILNLQYIIEDKKYEPKKDIFDGDGFIKKKYLDGTNENPGKEDLVKEYLSNV